MGTFQKGRKVKRRKRQTMKEDAFCFINPRSLPVVLYLTYPQTVFLAYSFQTYGKLTILNGLLEQKFIVSPSFCLM